MGEGVEELPEDELAGAAFVDDVVAEGLEEHAEANSKSPAKRNAVTQSDLRMTNMFLMLSLPSWGGTGVSNCALRPVVSGTATATPCRLI